MSSDPAHSIPAEASAPPLTEVPAPPPMGASSPTTSPEVAPHARRMLDRYEIIAEIAKGAHAGRRWCGRVAPEMSLASLTGRGTLAGL